jgi:hypothetical protein
MLHILEKWVIASVLQPGAEICLRQSGSDVNDFRSKTIGVAALHTVQYGSQLHDDLLIGLNFVGFSRFGLASFNLGTGCF